jgi:hypothetical protein
MIYWPLIIKLKSIDQALSIFFKGAGQPVPKAR